jgi:hypothetical protein
MISMKVKKALFTKISAALLSVLTLAAVSAPVASAYLSSIQQRPSTFAQTSTANSKYAAQGLTAYPTSRYSAVLYWSTPASVQGAAYNLRYYVYRVYNSKAFLVAQTGSWNFVTLSGLEATQTQTYFVRTSHPNSTGVYDTRKVSFSTSNYPMQITTGNYPRDTKAPTAPSALTASVSGYSLTLRWRVSQDNRTGDKGIAGYRIYRWRDYVKYPVGEVVSSATSGYLTYTISNIELSPRHAFSVQAVDKAGHVAGGTLSTVIYVNSNVNNIRL